MKTSKRMNEISTNIPKNVDWKLEDAFEFLKSNSKVKFTESIDVSIHLGIDARKSDQIVRGSTLLPHGTGKTKRVIVFAAGQEALKVVGAERVGAEDLVEAVKNGTVEFDAVIATPDMMKIVTPLGKILGPRGLMPNPRFGTVTDNIVQAVQDARGNKIFFRNDKAGIVHALVGRTTFSNTMLCENLFALLRDLKNLQPSTSKGVYLKSLNVSSTMGCSIKVRLQSLNYN